MQYQYSLMVRAFFLSLTSLSALAQTYPHTALWVRMSPTYALNSRWSLVGDGYFRRQSNPGHGLLNPLRSPSLWAGRVGISARTTHWQYTLFPVVYFHTYPSLGSAADLSRPPAPEWRPSVYAEWTLSLPPKSVLRLRGGYEYRMFAPTDFADVGRLRFRVLWRRDLTERVYGQLWNETLLAAPPRLTANANRIEINRTNVGVGYVLTNKSTVEVGYQFTHRQRRSLVEFDEEHALTLTLYQRLTP